jgi:hypothetical protein
MPIIFCIFGTIILKVFMFNLSSVKFCIKLNFYLLNIVNILNIFDDGSPRTTHTK